MKKILFFLTFIFAVFSIKAQTIAVTPWDFKNTVTFEKQITYQGVAINPFIGQTNSGPINTTAVGYGSGNLATLSGHNNTTIGYLSGGSLTTGYSNILFGVYSGRNLTTGHGNILIGDSALLGFANLNNRIMIASGVRATDTTTALMWANQDSKFVNINGDLNVRGKIFQTGAGWTYSAYSGGSYTLTSTPAQIATVSQIVIALPGTYMIFGNADFETSGATWAGTQQGTIKIRRTNNTAADLTNATYTITIPIQTTTTTHLGTLSIPVTIYTTANVNDILQLWGSVSATPSVGSAVVSQAYILAVKL